MNTINVSLCLLVYIFYTFLHSKNRVHDLDSDSDSDQAAAHADPSDNIEDDPFTHFSTFALSGSNGTVRWHHLPGDYEMKDNKVHSVSSCETAVF